MEATLTRRKDSSRTCQSHAIIDTEVNSTSQAEVRANNLEPNRALEGVSSTRSAEEMRKTFALFVIEALIAGNSLRDLKLDPSWESYGYKEDELRNLGFSQATLRRIGLMDRSSEVNTLGALRVGTNSEISEKPSLLEIAGETVKSVVGAPLKMLGVFGQGFFVGPTTGRDFLTGDHDDRHGSLQLSGMLLSGFSMIPIALASLTHPTEQIVPAQWPILGIWFSTNLSSAAYEVWRAASLKLQKKK